MSGPLRILIVDDERPARLNLGALVHQHEAVRVVGACASGREALHRLRDEDVDLVLLDVQMPGMTGIDVVRALDPDRLPFVVFVTAYERHALAAFELAALDYLLKPVSRRRLAEAIRRVRSALADRQLREHRAKLRSLLDGLEADSEGDGGAEPPDTRLVIRSGRRRSVVPFDEIVCLEAWGNYVRVTTAHAEYLHRATLGGLEERLPAGFVRVHRSAIVRVSALRRVDSKPGGGCLVTLIGGKEVTVARRRAASVRRLLARLE